MRLERAAGFTTGVKCDLCGGDQDGDFTYYSLDVREVSVAGNRYPASVSALPVIFSFDVCHGCMANIGEAVRANYAPTKVGINCDICSGQMRGDFKFYYVDVASVGVNMSGGDTKCGACNKVVINTVCTCGKNEPIKVAKLAINDKYLQLVLCQADYDRLTESAAAIRRDTKGG